MSFVWRGLVYWVVGMTAWTSHAADSLMLHPQNPRYFLWRGQPTVLITSGEHYGAVLNLDFDYVKYLRTLARDRLNLTRTFTGAGYFEPPGAFHIAGNTLAPAPGRYLGPWARSREPGFAGGGNKFDLHQWNEAYFARFRDFVREAGQRGVVVEVNLFCPFYEDVQWQLSPFSTNNNVNGYGRIERTNVYTLGPASGLRGVQERFTRRLVEELRDFDNVYYEICNEPYFGGVMPEWQQRIGYVIEEAQQNHKHQKLISQNIANHTANVSNLFGSISILNFHYASPPDAVGANYELFRVIGDNETGFRGTGDAPYRMEGWDFIVAGGGLFNNLDYSFSIGHEDGTFTYPASQPGGGNAGFRRQMRGLHDFISAFNFVNMRPDNDVIRGGVPSGYSARALVDPGHAYALYLRPGILTRFSVRWTGKIEVPRTGDYTFHTFSNDGIRLWVEGKPVIDDWSDHDETEDQGTVRLDARRRYRIKLEYFYNGGNAVAKLWWSTKSSRKQPVPTSAFWAPDGVGRGLRGEYFEGTDLKKPWREREDAQINFSWGATPPFGEIPRGATSALELELPAGRYQAEWVNPASGEVMKSESFAHEGGKHSVAAPRFTEDIALRVLAR